MFFANKIKVGTLALAKDDRIAFNLILIKTSLVQRIFISSLLYFILNL